jgi:hypothetical protein
MIATKTNLMLFAAVTLSAGSAIAMDQQPYTMTIQNKLYAKMFLNVPNPKTLTDSSPYAFVEGRETKTFLISPEEIGNQSIAIPGGWPSNNMQLPINKKDTHFIIKNHPEDHNKIILEDNSKNIISELFILSNAD